MTFHIITLFPEMFGSYLNESILARAQKEGKIEVKFYNPRDFAEPTDTQKEKEKPYLRVDDRPFGGGPGMVMQALPVIRAIEQAHPNILQNVRMSEPEKLKTKNYPPERLESFSRAGKLQTKIFWLSPSGKQFDTKAAKTCAKKYSDIIFICGRYEGIDERVRKIFKAEPISVGPFVLTGGELPAMIMIDSISRQIKGVLGDFDSLEENRAASPEIYTRPEVLEYNGKKYRAPKILLSGNHAKIDAWRSGKNEK